MTEFSGGVPKPAVIPLTSWESQSFKVEPIFEWDASSGDKLSEILQEKIESGEDIRTWLLKVLAPDIRDLIASALRKMLSRIREAKDPKIVADQLAWASGLAMMEGDSVQTLATKRGVAKQAIQQGAKKFKRELFRKEYHMRSQSERSAEARKTMSQRNKRNTKVKGVWDGSDNDSKVHGKPNRSAVR